MDKPLVQINQKLHFSVIYNGLQLSVNALAIFTGASTTTMKCFVAGTMILTAAGLVAIENIKAGNKVISTNPETFEVVEKTVLETYVRETTELVHLTINGELIKTTHDHPFYVKDVGFVSAGELYIGDKLLDSNGNTLLVEDREVENLDEPVKVYNFQVEGFHTYHVGENTALVHNADYSDQLIPNKREGLRRENEVQLDLEEQYPKSQGYNIAKEKLLRDFNGKKAIDPETGTGRRIDFVVDKYGNIVDSIEVTSTSADKSAQIAKESRIRESGGNYVRLDDGRLVEIPEDVVTRIVRRK